VAPPLLLCERCATLGLTIGLADAANLIALLDRITIEPQNLTSITDLDLGIDRHLVDSLCGLLTDAVQRGGRLIDLGSGAGFPGLPLAVACPALDVTLVESERSKADWLVRQAVNLPNVTVVNDRAEHVATRARGTWDVVTARALGPLPTVLELAAPLLVEGGSLVAWRGHRTTEDDDAAASVAKMLGLSAGPVVGLELSDGSTRHLHAYTRTGIVPERFPRRAGLAAKRPLTVSHNTR
jgi:16S rRNA (guanine527-N7)-methyltransferase